MLLFSTICDWRRPLRLLNVCEIAYSLGERIGLKSSVENVWAACGRYCDLSVLTNSPVACWSASCLARGLLHGQGYTAAGLADSLSAKTFLPTFILLSDTDQAIGHMQQL